MLATATVCWCQVRMLATATVCWCQVRMLATATVCWCQVRMLATATVCWCQVRMLATATGPSHRPAGFYDSIVVTDSDILPAQPHSKPQLGFLFMCSIFIQHVLFCYDEYMPMRLFLNTYLQFVLHV